MLALPQIARSVIPPLVGPADGAAKPEESSMRWTRKTTYIAALAAVAWTSGRAVADHNVRRTIDDSSDVLTAVESVGERRIPQAVLADAQGIAIIPRVVKAGFIVGGRVGHGLVYSRLPDGGWTGPVFVHVGGASLGFQAGVESTDLVLVFKTRRGLERILQGKDKLTLGGDASIAAGPVGREAQAATDGALRAEIYSYSRSRGLFAGVSFEGAVLAYDYEQNREFERSPPDVKGEAAKLAGKIMTASGQRMAPPPAAVVPMPQPPPPVILGPAINPPPAPPPPPPGR
jgi:lipid-binding SYLF domain-containing protein